MSNFDDTLTAVLREAEGPLTVTAIRERVVTKGGQNVRYETVLHALRARSKMDSRGDVMPGDPHGKTWKLREAAQV